MMIPLFIVILGIIGFAGWYVWNANHKSDKGSQQQTNLTNQLTAGDEELGNTATSLLNKIFYIKGGDLWSVDSLATTSQKIVDLNDNIGRFCISPDNKYIAVSDINNQVWLSDINGDNQNIIIGDHSSIVQWLSDNRLVISQNGKIYLSNPEGNLSLVTTIPSDAYEQDYSITLSPDGQKVIYRSPATKLWLINIDGSNKKLVHDISQLREQYGTGGVGGVADSEIVWLPNSRDFIFNVSYGNQGELYTGSIDGDAKKISNDSNTSYMQLSWLAGNKIAAEQSGQKLITVNADGGDLKECQYTPSSGSDNFGFQAYGISPSGNEAALISGYTDPSKPAVRYSYSPNAFRIDVIDLGTCTTRPLVNDMGASLDVVWR